LSEASERAEVTVPFTQNYEEIIVLNNHPWFDVPENFYSWMGRKEPVKVKMSEVTNEIHITGK
jgi:hypothetical protein